ncbi:MAG: hypothetical protein IPL52_06150 [Flavobacteriales bacterium]|nr:hypothetical protein [Flavobacteriales bacterium]
MPRKSQDHLHRLIRSMTRAEKRYFKLFIGRHAPEGASHQQLLFDAIARMETYDEAGLLLRFAAEAFTHRFAVTKRRLYESVLRSLDAFHAESSVDVRLYRLLHQVEILYQRTLYADAMKMLLSVRRLASQHDRTHALVAASEWERRIMESNNYADVHEERLKERADADAHLVQQQAQLNGLWDLKSRLFLQLYRDGQARDATAHNALAALLDHPLLKDASMLRTAKARFLYHHIRGAAAFAMGDTSGCHAHLTANLSLLNSERERFVGEPNLVLGVMSNLIYVCIQRGMYNEAFAHLRSFRTLPSQWNMPESDDLDLKLFTTTASLELSMHLRLGDFDKALELVPVVVRGLAEHAHRMGPVRRAGFHYHLAYAYFGAGQYDKALRWVNELTNDARADDHSDPVCAGRLLQLLILLELGKKDLLTYTLRNTERFLRLRGRKHRFEPLLLHLVRGLVTARNASARKELLERFHASVLPLADEAGEHVVFDHFDPIAWAESKITGEPFSMRIKRRIALGRAA